MSKIFKFEEINFDKITFLDIDKNIIYMHYKDNNPLLIETPALFCVDKIENNKTKYTTHELLVTLSGKNIQDTNKTKTFFQKLDEKLIQIGKQNIKNWNLNDQNIMYKSLIKNIDDDNNHYKNGIIKVKFIKTKTFSTLMFDNNKQIINIEKYNEILTGNNFVKMILELVCVWLKDNVYGIYIRLHQIKILNGNIPLILNEYSFDENSDSDSDNDEKYFYDTERPSIEYSEIKQNIDSIINKNIEYNKQKHHNNIEIDGYEYILTDSSSESL